MIDLKDKKIKIYNEDYDPKLLQMYLEHEGYNYEITPKVGDTISGTIALQNRNYLMIDIGYKDYVLVDNKREELTSLERMGNKKVGDSVDVFITSVKENPYQILGSFSQLEVKAAYNDIIDSIDACGFLANVIDWSPAGFRLELIYNEHLIPAFMPNTLAGINKLSNEQSQDFVGKQTIIMIESYSEDKGTFIASRKKYLQTLIPSTLESLKIKNEFGEPVEFIGTVTGTTKTGVFVEFNECLTGMIHLTNLKPEIASSLDTIQPGDPISFLIKEVIGNKLFLTQVWRKTIWDTITEGIQLEGTVMETKKFGLLVRLDEETVGLIPTVDLEKSKRNFQTGDKVNVKVNKVQRLERKISLLIA